MPGLSFLTLAIPQGLTNGQFTPWSIQWQLPPETPDGFVIQHMRLVFQGIHYCGDDSVLSDETIWNLLDYEGEPRLEFWETWQLENGVWKLPGCKDGWGFSRSGTLYSSDTAGAISFTGHAGFYPGNDLNAFGDGWGQNGDNSGSPMSGDLMSTTQTPTLPETTLIERTMLVSWSSCGCDSDDAVCRKTTVTTGPAEQGIT